MSALAQIGVRGWPGYAGDAQHTARSFVAANDMLRIRWSTPVDLNPQYSGDSLLIHYGTPLITKKNTVIVTVKTGASSGFKMEGRRGTDGALLWTQTIDYTLPSASWTPSVNSTLTPDGRLISPGIGGTVMIRSDADDPAATVTRVAFYGIANYNANQSTFNSNVKINTPITCDANGNIFFGFSAGSNPIGLQSGLARIAADGTGAWVGAKILANDQAIGKVATNCAPALSNDGSIVYVALNSGGAYLAAANATNLFPITRVVLRDPKSNSVATMSDNSTASPMVGPDGDVYYGILENPFGSNNRRGWLLHFDSSLAVSKTPGAFGWDDTPSVVPATMVPSYTGPSQYLLCTKYNDYLNNGSFGDNKIAILDPATPFADPRTGINIMKEVWTKLAPTPDPRGGWIEWCINTAAIDPLTNSAIINSEDGKAYRWDLVTNALTQILTLTGGVGEAYTPTVIGPDGTVYCINNALLFAISDNRVWPTAFNRTRGVAVSGTLADVNYSDDSRLVTRQGPILSLAEAPINITFDATSFTATAGALKFTLEANVSTTNLQQKIELFNYTTNAFEVVDTRTSAATDSVATVNITTDASRFINATTKAMRARVSYKAIGPILSMPWQARIDQVMWTVTP
jgi:hypothetical protein